jgi:putative RecB family exonuclease
MPVYSHSRLETFETCALKYKFKYIEKVETAIEQSVEAFVGSRVHDVLEKLYDDLRITKINSLDELLAYYGDRWKKEWGPGILIADQTRRAEDYFTYGEKCIRNYYERFKPFDQARTLGLEMRLNFALDTDGQRKIMGFVDRVARRADGTYEIHDYKTSSHLPAQADADSDRQLSLYQIGLTQRWRDVEHIELVWHYLAFDQDLVSTRTPEDLATVREETIRQIQTVEREKEFAPNQGRWCDWCEFRPVCPVWKHVDAVAALPPEQLSTDAGVKLVDEFAEVSKQEAELRRQKDDLREKILAFAEQMGIARIQGTGVGASISLREQTKFPGKHDVLHQDLAALLKKAGRWDEVSDLDAARLAEILEDESWPPDLTAELRRFATFERTKTVRLSGSNKEKAES